MKTDQQTHLDNALDEALTRTFPASDPIAVAVTQADDGVFLDNAAARRFELKLADGTAFIAYEPAPGTLKIMHTEVPKALAGRGIGNRIAALVVAEARRRGLRLIPRCDFFAAYLKKHPEHADVVAGNVPD